MPSVATAQRRGEEDDTSDGEAAARTRAEASETIALQSQSQIQAWEAEIDALVYQLYDLTPEEIAIVEGSNKQTTLPITEINI